MKVTLVRRLQLGVVFLVIRALWALDDIGNVTKKTLADLFRLSLYMIVVTVALTGFFVKSQNSYFYNIPNVLSPESSEVLGSAVKSVPIFNKKQDFPNISAVSVYAVDKKSNMVLVDINSDFTLAPASTTKIMTALVALDLYGLEESLSIPDFCTEIEGLKAGFLANDYYTVENLLYSLLVNSSADAACTLAIGKITYSEFISEMNQKAKKIGLENTSFSNPIGLDGANGDHYSTAKDLYLLANKATEYNLIKEIVKTQEVIITSNSGYSTILYNTNDLLWTQEGSVGIKTGKTEAAGEVLIYEYDLDEKNIIISIMHSSDRFTDTLAILDWILLNYTWIN